MEIRNVACTMSVLMLFSSTVFAMEKKGGSVKTQRPVIGRILSAPLPLSAPFTPGTISKIQKIKEQEQKIYQEGSHDEVAQVASIIRRRSSSTASKESGSSRWESDALSENL